MNTPFTFTRKFPFVARKAAPVDTFESAMDDFFVARDRLSDVFTRNQQEATEAFRRGTEAFRRATEAEAAANRADKARTALDNLLGLN